MKVCMGIRHDAKAYDCELCGQYQKPIFLKCKKIMEEKSMAKLLKKSEVKEVVKSAVKKVGAKADVKLDAKKATKEVKATKAVAKKTTDVNPDYEAGKLWREGTSGQIILDAALGLLKKAKAITWDQVFKAISKELESDNPEGRVKHILNVATKRELISKNDDGQFVRA